MNNEIRSKITREYNAKRNRALADAARRKEALYARCPALAELDAKAARLSVLQLRHRLGAEKDGVDYTAEMEKIMARRKELMSQMQMDIEPHFECDLCQDTGKIATGYCNCFLSRLIEENLANANLSITSTHQRFENFDLSLYSDQKDATVGRSPREHMELVFNRCRQFVREFDTGSENLLLQGGPGLGKTFLSSAIAHSLLEQGKTVIYVSATEFFNRVQANKFGDQGELIQPYYEADLLILDDLGTEFRTQLTTSVLGEVIDRRLRSNKRMIFSTNLSARDVENTYPQRIVSRLQGRFLWLPCMGTDNRLKGK